VDVEIEGIMINFILMYVCVK